MAAEKTETKEVTLPFDLVKKLVIISLAVGLAGGFGGGWLWQEIEGPAAKELVLQESSAVIDIANEVSPSVVSITTAATGVDFFGINRRQVTGAGTGVILTADGLILTNKHVVQGAEELTVFTSDGKEFSDGRVVARDPFNDIAFIKINASGLKPAKLGDSSQAQVGQKVVAIGNALGQFQNTVTTGIISGLGRPIVAGGEDGNDPESLQNLFQTDAAINPGNSGGPLVNLEGEVIGINTAIAGGAENIGFAIPINEAKPLIDSVKETGRIERPYLGVRFIPITREFAGRNDLPVEEGAYISGGEDELAVVPDSPAAKAGLREGDIITHVAGAKIDRTHSLTGLIADHKVGEEITLTVIRDGDEREMKVTLEAAPQNL